MASIDEKQRRALLALAALPGVPLQALHVSGIAEVPDIEPSLMALVRRGLVVSSQSRHQLADGVGDRLRRTEDLKPWVNRAITYFTAWAERYRRSRTTCWRNPKRCCVCSSTQPTPGAGEKFFAWVGFSKEHWSPARDGAPGRSRSNTASPRRRQSAIDRPKPGRFMKSAFEPYVSARRASARALLSQAVKLREALNDDAAAAASRRNLSFVLPPVSDHPQKHTAQLDDVFDLGSLPLRDGAQPTLLRERKKTAQALPIAVLLFAIASGLAYLWSLGGFDSYLAGGLGWATAAPATAPPQRASGEPRVVQAAADLPALALSGPPDG